MAAVFNKNCIQSNIHSIQNTREATLSLSLPHGERPLDLISSAPDATSKAISQSPTRCTNLRMREGAFLVSINVAIMVPGSSSRVLLEGRSQNTHQNQSMTSCLNCRKFKRPTSEKHCCWIKLKIVTMFTACAALLLQSRGVQLHTVS